MDRKVFVITVLSTLIFSMFLLFTTSGSISASIFPIWDEEISEQESTSDSQKENKMELENEVDPSSQTSSIESYLRSDDDLAGKIKGNQIIIKGMPPRDITEEAKSGLGNEVIYKQPTAYYKIGNKPFDVKVECEPESGETFKIGKTVVTCTAIDDSGYKQRQFNVKVVDGPPNINAQNTTGRMYDASGATVSFAVMAIDAVDGQIPEENINCNPKSGTLFEINNTKVSCAASDSRGNNATKSFYVILKDEEPPKIDDVVNLKMVAKTQNPSKAAVQFSINAIDAVDGQIPEENINCNPKSGSEFSVGISTPITCNAYDKSKNIATASFELDLSS
jgi:hypothetical protein